MSQNSIDRSAVATASAGVLCCLLGGVSGAWAGDGVVALQTAAASCADDSGDRYVDCGNGTVTDNQSGLVWLKDANCIGSAGGGTATPAGVVDWFTAIEFVAGLADLPDNVVCGVSSDPCDCGLSDGSSPGEWRLPSIAEWKAMVAEAVALGCLSTGFGGPSITDDSGTQCWQEGPGNSFTGIETSESYWSSTTDISLSSNALVQSLHWGSSGSDWKYSVGFVWPVRGGQ